MNISETTPSKNSMALPVDEQLSKMREDPRVSEINLKKILQDKLKMATQQRGELSLYSYNFEPLQ